MDNHDESEIFVCKHCGKEHEALTQEIGSYRCPNLKKSKGNMKVLDSVSLKYLTKFNSSSETQDHKHHQDFNGDTYGQSKYSSCEEKAQEQESCSDRNVCSNADKTRVSRRSRGNG